MKTKKLLVATFMVASALFLGSCSKDEAQYFPPQSVNNVALMNVLKSKGYSFNNEGKLEINDKVLQTTSLDLSGTNLTDLKELSVFPHLTELILANNHYGPVFNFDNLPSSITSVDLSGNEIYDFEHLVEATIENNAPKITAIKPLKKLVLPETSKYNIEDVVVFYLAKGNEVNLQMADKTGKVMPYNTIREIPDTALCTYLKGIYGSMFVDNNHIDISKQPILREQGAGIALAYPFDASKIKNIEGLEYFINNPYTRPFQVIIPERIEHGTLSYLMPRANLSALIIPHINIKAGLDCSQATKLLQLDLNGCEGVTKLDLTNTRLSHITEQDLPLLAMPILKVTKCPNLEEIIFPEIGSYFINQLFIGNLPKLKTLNLSSVTMLYQLVLGTTNTNLILPNVVKVYDEETSSLTNISINKPLGFAFNKDMRENETIKNYLEKNKGKLYSPFLDFDTRKDFEVSSWK